MVDTTIVHVCGIANTGLVTPHLDAEGMFAYDTPRTMKAPGQTVCALFCLLYFGLCQHDGHSESE